MRKTIRRLTVMLLAICLFSSLLGASALASTQSVSAPVVDEKWNIMLVVDGSGSLFSDQMTDPDGLRFSAIDSFLNILSILDAQSGSSGKDVVCNAGGIVFSGTEYNSTTEASMLRGIRMNTGLIPFDGSSGSDMTIARKIRNAPLDYNSVGTTDIGTALLVAASELEAAAASDVKSAIFLFTDGNTDMTFVDTYNKSMENLATAEQKMRDNDIELCGVFLNKDGASQSQEVMNIVISANDLGGNGAALASHYAEITNSESIQPAMDIFLKCLGLTVQTPIEVHFPIHQEMRIPGGVKSVTIRLYSADGSGMPGDMTAQLTAPDGTVISGAALDAITTNGNSFRNYMILNPASGTWVFDADSAWAKANDSKVYFYSPVVDCYTKAGMEITPSADQLHANSVMNTKVFLIDQGVEVTDPTAYKEYKCMLSFVDTKTLAVKTIELAPNSKGRFEQLVTLDFYGTYDVSAYFECDSVQIATQDPITLILENHAPDCNDIKLNVRYGLFQPKVTSYNVLKNSSDIEDGKSLSLSILSGSCNTSAVRVVGHDLMIEGKAVGNGNIRIQATDSQGATAEFNVSVTVQNMTLIIALAALGTILLVGVAVIIIMRSKARPDGTLTLEFNYNSSTISVDLPCPGNGYTEKASLYKLITDDLNSGRDNIKSEALRLNKNPDDVKMTLIDDRTELEKVIVTASSKKIQRKKKGVIKVKYGKKSITLYNSDTGSYLQTVNDAMDYTLCYNAAEDADGSFDDDDYDMPVKSKRKGWSKKSGKKGRNFDDEDDF